MSSFTFPHYQVFFVFLNFFYFIYFVGFKALSVNYADCFSLENTHNGNRKKRKCYNYNVCFMYSHFLCVHNDVGEREDMGV